MHSDVCRCTADFGQFFRCQLDGQGVDVLLQPVQLCRSRDRNDPRLLREQPRNRYLRCRHVLLRSELSNHIDNRLIAAPIFLAETR